MQTLLDYGDVITNRILIVSGAGQATSYVLLTAPHIMEEQITDRNCPFNYGSGIRCA